MLVRLDEYLRRLDEIESRLNRDFSIIDSNLRFDRFEVIRGFNFNTFRELSNELHRLHHLLEFDASKYDAFNEVIKDVDLVEARRTLRYFTYWVKEYVDNSILIEDHYTPIDKLDEKINKISSLTLWVFKEYIERLHKSGIKCGFSIPYRKEVTLAEVVNDLSNCIHMYAEKIAEVTAERIGNKVYVVSEPDRRLIKIAELWDKLTEEQKKEMIPEDYKALISVLNGRHGTFRVGSSPDHATHIEVKDNEMEIEYHDRDSAVVTTVEEALEKYAKCKCEYDRSEGVLKCKCPIDRENIIASTMASVTSMDIRLERVRSTQEKELKRIIELAEKY